MIVYRTPMLADGPALDAMARQIWLETFEHSASPENIAAYVAGAYGPDGKLLRDLADPAVRFHVADDVGRIAGYCKLTAPFVEEAGPGDVQLSQLYVAADYHGRGIAQTLMDWALTTARADGAPALLLTVWEENHRAKRFYDRYGFVHVGDYAFPTGDQIDRDLVMRLAL